MLHSTLACMLHSTLACAGAVEGCVEGLIRVTSKEVVNLVHGGVTVPRKSSQPLHKPLLNVVVVGDQGCGKTSLVHRYSGRALDGNIGSTQRADFCMLEATVAEQPATFCVWHVGGSEEAAGLGGAFYSMASACAIVYNPGQPGACASLDCWAAQCRGADTANEAHVLPLVVLANCWQGGDAALQAATMSEAQEWCRQHGGTPHFIVQGLEDLCGIQGAFQALLLLAVRRHEQVHANATPTSPRISTGKIAALFQSELAACAPHGLDAERQPQLVQPAS